VNLLLVTVVVALVGITIWNLFVVQGVRRQLKASRSLEILTSLNKIELLIGKFDSTVRDELRDLKEQEEKTSQRAREEASSSARHLREETMTLLTALGAGLSDKFSEFKTDVSDTLQKLQTAVTAQIDAFGTINIHQQRAARDQVETAIKDFQKETTAQLEGVQTRQSEGATQLKDAVQMSLGQLGSDLRETTQQLSQVVKDRLAEMTNGIRALVEDNQRQQQALKQVVDDRLDRMSEANAAKLEEMRVTVDEKLHTTLERRLTESFGLVSDQLGKVQTGLGEMRDIATSVGDLKRVLSNVKVRGGFAEVQLGMQLEQMLASDQYVSNVQIDPDNQETVEFAIKFPALEDGSEVLLPIDAKFPKEDWERLEDAQLRADSEGVSAAGKALENRVRAEARRISEKYVIPPRTTNFAVMFLPTEGLFAEVVRRPGLVDHLQTKYRVTVAGPTTFMALLTSLQMGFRTVAIQKKGAEVWKVLSAAKIEFQKFGILMDKVEKQVGTVQNTLGEVGRRTRAINRRLGTVHTTAMQSSDTAQLLETGETTLGESGSDEDDAATGEPATS
jgi:DNA recombination protein RmuC